MGESYDKKMDALKRVDIFMNSLTDLDELLIQIMNVSQEVTNAEAISLALYDEIAEDLFFEIALGEKGSKIKTSRVKVGEGIMGTAARTGESIIVADAYENTRFAKWADQKTGFKTRSILAVPMIRRGRLIGVIEALNRSDKKSFDEEDKNILELLAHQAGIAIENAHLYSENLRKERLASLGQGISGAAHCIKNVVNILSMGQSVIEQGIKMEDIGLVESSWKHLNIGIGRVTDLVMDMLSFSKDRMLELQPLDLNKFLDDVIIMVSKGLEEKEIVVKTDLHYNVIKINANSNSLNRCIMNLISNATDAIGNGGGIISVQSRISEQSSFAEIIIKDTGPGIPPESLTKIFEIFYSTKGSEGTGIGLSLTKKIVEEHNGSISVDSELGKGTSFTIQLPHII